MLCLHDMAAAFLLRLLAFAFLLRLSCDFCFAFAAVATFCCGCWAAVLLCVWSMYPEFALCFFQDDISAPHAS